MGLTSEARKRVETNIHEQNIKIKGMESLHRFEIEKLRADVRFLEKQSARDGKMLRFIGIFGTLSSLLYDSFYNLYIYFGGSAWHNSQRFGIIQILGFSAFFLILIWGLLKR